MNRRDFLKAAVATTGVGFLMAGNDARGTSHLFIGEEDVQNALETFPWNTPPQTANGEYVDSQGSLPIRTVLSDALKHPASSIYVGYIGCWSQRRYCFGIRDVKVCVPTYMLRGTCFEMSSAIRAAAKYNVGKYGDFVFDGYNVRKKIAEEMRCPGAYLINVSRGDEFDVEWTRLIMTMIFPYPIFRIDNQ